MISSTSRVNVDRLVPSAVTTLGLAIKVLVAPDGVLGKKVTLAFRAVPPTVAVIVFTAACVLVSVVVKTPEPFVGPDAGEKVLWVPVALIVTVEPITGLPEPLSTVTVMVVVEVPSAVTTLGLATMVDRVGLTNAAVNTKLALALMVPATKAVTVSACTKVDESVVL